MATQQHPQTWRSFRLAGSLALPILFPLGAAWAGQPPRSLSVVQAKPPAPAVVPPQPISTTPPTAVQPITAPAAAPAVGQAPAQTLGGTGAESVSQAAATRPNAIQNEQTLAQCIQIALQQQPAVNAARSSLAAAETGRRALANLHVPTFLSPDLPYRRQQAALGVASASAALEQTERETVYAVTRLYYTVAFAREQKKVADAVVANM